MGVGADNPHWYRVANLRPELAPHARFHRHVYRGEVWYVLRDAASGRVHRFAPLAHDFIARMDGRRTVDEIWALTEHSPDEESLTQDEVVELLGRLHGADLLKADIAPDSHELFRRYRARVSSQWKSRLSSPLSVRIPLVDPDRFLDRTIGWVSPAFSRVGAAVWVAIVVTAAILAASHWGELTENLADRVLAPSNLFLLWLTFPVIKLFHELGHGYAAKRWGGEVHEMGLMVLVFVPLPYVDASSASAMPERSRRAIVGAAGIFVEMLLASLALFLWLNVEPGLLRTLAFDVMFIGGVSTILFNGNPLLRFDGYYVLADLIDAPNLAARSRSYLGYLVQRYAFRRLDARSPVIAASERGWLFAYSIAAFVYRLFIMSAIVLFVAGKFFVIGVLLAIWAVATQVAVPLVRQTAFLFASPTLEEQRGRAISATAVAASFVLGVVFLAPFPSQTRTEGVVLAPENSEVRSAADAVIVEFVAEPGSEVGIGDTLLVTKDAALATRVAVLEAELEEFNARYNLFRATNQVEAAIARDDIETLQASLAVAREQLAKLTIRSETSGVFLVERPQDLEGRFLRQGDLIGYVADPSRSTVRVAVRQADIGLVRSWTRDVSVRLADRVEAVLAARIAREVPAASRRLPSAALGTRGGGPFAVNPADETGLTAVDDVFLFELEVDRPIDRLGGRAYVRFDHGVEPLGWQWYRNVRQLFLSRFHV